jgi:hypothetical protein
LVLAGGHYTASSHDMRLEKFNLPLNPMLKALSDLDGSVIPQSAVLKMK